MQGAVESTVAVIGAGYVGLTTGVCFAHLGHNVVCADIDADRIDRLSRAECPIVEEGLEELLLEGIRSGRLRFVVGAENAVGDAEFVYLCVPTPGKPDGSVDLSYVQEAARTIAPQLRPASVVVNKSTVPAGSTRLVERAIGRPDVAVVSNPEFLREGSAVRDFLNPDRVVIGADDEAAAIRVAALYLGVRAPLMVTDPASAETIKYASNAFLATKLSFVNELAAVCEAVGANLDDVVLGMGYDHRIGAEHLRAGPGWGGSCFPKDTRALVATAREGGYDFGLLRGVLASNDQQFERVTAKVRDMLGGSVAGTTVAVWGLTFKAGTDDLRDSPALEIVGRLHREGARVRAYDPAIDRAVVHCEVVHDPYEACDGASVLVVLTEWDEFRWRDLDKVAELMAEPRVVDARGVLDLSMLRRIGFDVAGLHF